VSRGPAKALAGGKETKKYGRRPNREQRVRVYEDTVALCSAGGPYHGILPQPSELFRFQDSRYAAVADLLVHKPYITDVQVVNEDVLVIAERLANAGEGSVMVLNLASYWHMAYGWRS
jgi:hypothetical protein